MSATLEQRIVDQLHARRVRTGEDYLLYGISELSNLPKGEAKNQFRAALRKLAEEGKIERHVCSNGDYYRLPPR